MHTLFDQLQHRNWHDCSGVAAMNQAQIELVRGLQDRMNIIISNYRKDPMYAPPEWTFENIWHALEALIRLQEA